MSHDKSCTVTGIWLTDLKSISENSGLYYIITLGADIHNGGDNINDNYDDIISIIRKYGINQLPCKIDSAGSKLEYEKHDDQSTPTSTIDELFGSAIAASNDNNFQLAMKRFEEILKLDNRHKDALFNIASIYHMCGYPMLSVKYMEQLLLLTPSDMVSHSFLWALAQTESQSDKNMVIRAYEKLASKGGVIAQHKLATLTGDLAYMGNPLYAKEIFNDMAEVFEDRLVSRLGYSCPWIMRQLLDNLIAHQEDADSTFVRMATPIGRWRMLDLGCGSGLIGKIFGDFVQSCSTSINGNPINGNDEEAHIASVSAEAKGVDAKSSPSYATIVCAESDTGAMEGVARSELYAGGLLVGVDIADRMINQALRCGCYTHLHCADLTSTLEAFASTSTSTRASGNGKSVNSAADAIAHHSDEDKFKLDVVCVADTFLYIGALGKVFQLVHQVLRTSGIFMFTTEDLDSSPMRIPEKQKCSESNISKEEGGEDAISSSGVCMEDVMSFEPHGHIDLNHLQLLTSARYAHSQKYIETLSDMYKLRIVKVENVIVRTENTIPLPGKIYILQKD